jgi:YggT family protein
MIKVQLIHFTVYFVDILSSLIVYAIIARVIISWFTMGRPGACGRISQLLYDITEPVVNLARKIPHRIGMIDFAPLIALLGVDLISQLVIILLYKLV